jgi:hypothetical protein
MRLQADKLVGARPCIALHTYAESADENTRPLLLMATPGCPRCSAIRERQHAYDLAHPPAPPPRSSVCIPIEETN